MRVILSSLAKKQLRRTPEYIARKFDYWLAHIEMLGVQETRKYKGFHDEPLLGNWRNHRSVRLSKGYRVIYREINEHSYEVIQVMEVNKHDY